MRNDEVKIQVLSNIIDKIRNLKLSLFTMKADDISLVSEFHEIKFGVYTLSIGTKNEIPIRYLARAAFRVLQLLNNNDEKANFEKKDALKYEIKRAHMLLRDENMPTALDVKYDKKYDNLLFHIRENSLDYQSFVRAGLSKYFQNSKLHFSQRVVNRLSYSFRNFDFPSAWADKIESWLKFLNNETSLEIIENLVLDFAGSEILIADEKIQFLALSYLVFCDSEESKPEFMSHYYPDNDSHPLLISIAAKMPTDIVMSKFVNFFKNKGRSNNQLKICQNFFKIVNLDASIEDTKSRGTILPLSKKLSALAAGLLSMEENRFHTFANEIKFKLLNKQELEALTLVREFEKTYSHELKPQTSSLTALSQINKAYENILQDIKIDENTKQELTSRLESLIVELNKTDKQVLKEIGKQITLALKDNLLFKALALSRTVETKYSEDFAILITLLCGLEDIKEEYEDAITNKFNDDTAKMEMQKRIENIKSFIEWMSDDSSQKHIATRIVHLYEKGPETDLWPLLTKYSSLESLLGTEIKIFRENYEKLFSRELNLAKRLSALLSISHFTNIRSLKNITDKIIKAYSTNRILTALGLISNLIQEYSEEVNATLLKTLDLIQNSSIKLAQRSEVKLAEDLKIELSKLVCSEKGDSQKIVIHMKTALNNIRPLEALALVQNLEKTYSIENNLILLDALRLIRDPYEKLILLEDEPYLLPEGLTPTFSIKPIIFFGHIEEFQIIKNYIQKMFLLAKLAGISNSHTPNESNPRFGIYHDGKSPKDEFLALAFDSEKHKITLQLDLHFFSKEQALRLISLTIDALSPIRTESEKLTTEANLKTSKLNKAIESLESFFQVHDSSEDEMSKNACALLQQLQKSKQLIEENPFLNSINLKIIQQAITTLEAILEMHDLVDLSRLQPPSEENTKENNLAPNPPFEGPPSIETPHFVRVRKNSIFEERSNHLQLLDSQTLNTSTTLTP